MVIKEGKCKLEEETKQVKNDLLSHVEALKHPNIVYNISSMKPLDNSLMKNIVALLRALQIVRLNKTTCYLNVKVL